MKRLAILLFLLPSVCFADVDTVYLEGEKWDAYTDNGTEETGGTVVYWGAYEPLAQLLDAYFAFPIPDTIYDATIDSIKLSFYITSTDRTDSARVYGLQYEDCDTIEQIDLSGAPRTTALVAIGAYGAGQQTTIDFTAPFQEWIDDYTHSGTDHFGMVLDNYLAVLGVNYNGIYDYSNASYSNNTYLVIWTSAVVVRKKVTYPRGARYW